MPRKRKPKMQTLYGDAFWLVFADQCQRRGVKDVHEAWTAMGERRGKPLEKQQDSELRRSVRDLDAFFLDYIGSKRVPGHV